MTLAPTNRSVTLASIPAAMGDIKLAHSVFALPFAVLASFLAREPGSSWGRFAAQLAVVVVCMVLARTWAMLVNRWADREIDADNPRTAGRAIPSGRVSPGSAAALGAASAGGFLACCGMFWIAFGNPWPIALAVPTLAWIAFYSFTKRFTALCHVFLGGALAASPLAAAIAVRPEALADTPALWWLSGMVLCWVAGFDMIYALQDMDFDRSRGLHSAPARLGWRGASWLARGLHVLAFTSLVAGGLVEPRFGLVYWLAVAPVGGLLIAEHVVLARRGREGLQMAFFTLNGVVSCLLGLGGVLSLVL
ncbi:MAG: 4-hydroxybenzoate octaprenyltransferase [Phycisphaerales bacterium]|nr:MAG: 4-hydroxybenzoate octaprenyltransferase [Phycisphaerales bacterium]